MEKNLNENPAFQELPDESLNAVTGGTKESRRVGDKYFAFFGSEDKDRDRKYLCPRCSRPVHYGFWGRFYCDPCDEGWSSVTDLKLNFSSGLWEEISELEYIVLQRTSR